ncbi:potassium channel family protein [Microbacterium sp. GXF6406]
MTTVGYGDYSPVTALGRVLAVGLMVGGMVIIGVVTATLISDLNERIRAAAHVPEILDDERRPSGD